MNPPLAWNASADLTYVTIALCVLFGLVFGSFLNVCIARLPRHESLVHPRSRCPRCDVLIAAFDNIPLLSWLLLGGRCRSCGQSISWRYPFVEAATAGLFVACYLRFGLTIEGVGNAVFCFLLLGLAFTDAETMLLPDALTLPGIALGLLFATASGYASGGRYSGDSGLGRVGPPMCLSCAWHSAFESILYASIAAGMLLTVRWSYWIVRRSHGLGLGDVKLLAMMAAWMRIESTVLAFFVGVVAAATYSVAVLPFLKAEKGGASWLNRRLPLGTFLAAAAIYSVFFSDGTLRWYLSLFPH